MTEEHGALVAQIVTALRREGDNNERAIACVRVFEEAPQPALVEAAAKAVRALRGEPPSITEEAAVAAFTAHLLGQTGRRVVYTVGR